MSAIQTTQILFVDAAVRDADLLLSGIDPAIEVVRLSSTEDGLTQIARALDGRSGIESLHIMSHGAPGVLTLGNATIDDAALAGHGMELATIRAALAENADLMLYGCNVAANVEGEAFIDALAEATGADVAASVDPTGSALLSGDWDLEAHSGTIESTAFEVSNYNDVLASGILRNAFVRFGYSNDGTLGWGGNAKPGIQYDKDGNRAFLDTADFLTPGSPFEFFSVTANGSTKTNNNTNVSSPGMGTTLTSTELTTVGADTYGSLTYVSTLGSLKITQVYSLGATSQVISMQVTMENTGGANIAGVQYARGIDPDVDSNGLPGSTSSTNNVRGAPGMDADDIVLSTGPTSGRIIGLYSDSSFSHNTAVSPGWSTSPATFLATSGNSNGDSVIGMGFNVGTLVPGQSVSFSFAYVFAANAAALAASISQVPASNAAPTLTAMTGAVDTVVEDTQVEITYAELAAKANANDDDAVTGFVVKGVASGTLLIGSSAGTARAWTPGSNDTILSDGSLKLYWTPAANANGTLNAMTIVARDADGATSTTAVPVQVTVTAVNDAPTLSADAALKTIDEDAAVNSGSTVATLFAPRFADVDANPMLGGVIVTANGANAGSQGSWQYNSGDGWRDIGAVSDSAGLALSASTTIRFEPAANYNGTPDALTVHAADSQYAGGYTTGSDRVIADTVTDLPTAGISANSRTVSVTITAVNDAPVITSTAGAATLVDTSANDSAFLAQTGALSGILTATDAESASNLLTFSVRGGTVASSTWTKEGLYGTLTVNETTGAWTYVPGKTAAINALPEGAVVVDGFDFKVQDPQGGYSTQALAITITGSNDEPVLSSAIANQSFSGSGAWSYQVPAASFTDAEGTGLTYTATLADGDPLPVWLDFDGATRTFSGNPPPGWNNASLTIQVTATDDADVSLSDEFQLTLSGTANQPPVVSVPLAWKAVDAVNEVTTVTFSDTSGDNTIEFNGQSIYLPFDATAEDVASALASHGSYPDYTVAYAGGGDIIITTKEPGDRTNILSSDFTGNYFIDGGTATVGGRTDGAGWAYTIPPGTFTDPEGDTLTYSAYIIEPDTVDPDTGDLIPGSATLLANTPALSFDGVTLSGDGTAPSSTLIEIRAQDSSGGVAASQFQLVVYKDTQAATLVAGVMPATVGFIDGAGNGSYTLPASAFDYLDMASGLLLYSAEVVDSEGVAQVWPAWLEFDTATATFSGNPPAGTGDLNVQVTADNGSISSAPLAFTFIIDNANDPLVLTNPIPDQSILAGNAVGLTFTKPFTDPDGSAVGMPSTDNITYAATANGQSLGSFGLTLGTNESGDLTINGNPPGGTPYLNIVVTGTEVTGGTSASTSFTLNLGSADVENIDSVGALAANNAGVITVTGTPTQGETLTAILPTDDDGVASTVTYQWQVSNNGGDTWQDIGGARGNVSALTLAQSEAGKAVRVQAFYIDGGNVAEAPVSTSVVVADLPEMGAISVTGALAPGQALSATLSDADGLVNSAPTYQWQTSGDGSNWSNIGGATYSAYTLSNGDGGKYIRVLSTYTDDMNNVQTDVTSVSQGPVQLGAVAPVASNDAGGVTEASGANNAIPGSGPATGFLKANDSDANSGDVLTVSGLRSGSVEGFGDAASVAGATLTVTGMYGTLVVNTTTGGYSYTLNESNDSVQALAVGNTLTDSFNYTLTDNTLLSDAAVLNITINGANDLPTVGGVPVNVEVTENAPSALPLELLTLVDPDSTAFSLRLTVDSGTLRAVSSDGTVTVIGSDTATMVITAGTTFALRGWLADNDVYFTGAPNINGSGVATLSYALNDGSGFVSTGATTTLTADPTNDVPIVDANGAGVGNNAEVTFQPRASAVQIAPQLTLTDIDSTSLSSATVQITSGARDNQFGTFYETLSLSSAGQALTLAEGLSVSITPSASGALLTISGLADIESYQAVLREVLYNDSNPNAFAGDRTVTISVNDNGGALSNTASFATETANGAIAVGQRIFINGTDSGQLVAQVLDGKHFVASGPLTTLADGAMLSLRDGTGVVTTAVVDGPLVATTTVHVPWTPVIDMNGGAAGRDRTIAYVEDQGRAAIAASDASITDQGGLIRSLTVVLTNPLDNGDIIHETLGTPNASVMGWLATRLITATGNGSGENNLTGATQIVFTASGAGSDATNFQVALRGVGYTNTSQEPNTAQRVVTVSSIDVDGHPGVNASTFINPVQVNDAPQGINSLVLASEDQTYVFGASDFGFTDPADAADGTADSPLAVRISSLPANGRLELNGQAVEVNQTVSLTDIGSGSLRYVPAANASGAAAASFGFQVQDNGGVINGGIDLDPTPATMQIFIIPTNDAPVLLADGADLAAINEDATNNAGQTVAVLLGSISDVDTGMHSAINGTLTGMAVHAVTSGGVNGNWEFSLNGGDSWQAVIVGEGNGLLLSGSDLVRFVPDQIGGTSAYSLAQPSLSYYAWDQSAGTRGQLVSTLIRGGASALSTDGDTLSIAVNDVNDAPIVDVSGVATPKFSPRGEAVALFDSHLVLGDVDVGDILTSARVVLDGNFTLDNAFDTIYETLSSTLEGNVYGGSLGDIVISGNGTGDDPLLLTGNGTSADYKAALQSLVYNNTNPNAYAGARPVSLTLFDAATTTAGSGATSSTAVLLLEVNWGAVADLNGDSADGRNHEVTYVENGASVAIVASDASLTDQDGNIASVTVTLTNAQDGSAEELFVSPTQVSAFALIGITVTGNNSNRITLTGDQDGTYFQLALRAIQYVNRSDAPSGVDRIVTVTSLDVDGNAGVGAQTVIHIAPVNDAPAGIDSVANLNEDEAHALALADFHYSDAEGNALQSVIITTLPVGGALKLDGVEVIAGQEVSAADITAGKLVYTPAANANSTLNLAPTLGFQVRDAGGSVDGGVDLGAGISILTLSVAPVNDAPTAADGSGTPGASVSGALREGSLLSANRDISDVDLDTDGLAAATSYQWQSRSVPDGAWTDIDGAIASVYMLTGGEVNREVRVLASYTDGDIPATVYTLNSDKPERPAIVGDADGNIVLTLDTDLPVLIVDPEGDVTVINSGTGPLTVSGMPDDGTLTVGGAGPVTVVAPLGDIVIANAGPGLVSVTGLNNGTHLTSTGEGSVLIDHPAGDLTITNDHTGLVSVQHMPAGSTLVTDGTGPILVDSHLAPGEHLNVDASGNSNIQFTNTGAGTIDVTGDLQLDSGDPVTINMTGDGATAMTVAGSLSLDGTPLRLQLDEAYRPNLGDSITLLDNDGSDAVTGTFAGLPEGAPVYVGGQLFHISYAGGTGNDVVLTRVNDGPSGAVTISGIPTQKETLVASHTLADTDGMGTLSYRWLIDGAMIATGSSYVLTQADVGKAITVVASYTDAQGTTESVASAPTERVADANDAPTGSVLISGDPTLGRTLLAGHELADLDGMGDVSFQWQADGVNISGADGDRYQLKGGDIGKAISVVASYIDGNNTAEQVSSAATGAVKDGNGMLGTAEAQVPGLGGSAATGDGNGDGMQDSLQPSVASIALAQGDSGGSSFATLVADSVGGKASGNPAAALTDVMATARPADLPSWAQAPTDGISFTSHTEAPGSTQNFSLYVDASLGVNGYWAKNAEGLMVNLASAPYGGQMVMEGDKMRLDFHITEGSEFDASAPGDTTIVGSGIAAHASMSIIGYAIDNPAAAGQGNIWD